MTLVTRLWGPIVFQLKDHSMDKRWKFKIVIVSWFLNQLEPWLAWLKSWKNYLFPISWEIEISRTIRKSFVFTLKFRDTYNFHLKEAKESTKGQLFSRLAYNYNTSMTSFMSLTHSTPHPTLTLCSSRIVTIYDEKGRVFAVVYELLIRYDV